MLNLQEQNSALAIQQIIPSVVQNRRCAGNCQSRTNIFIRCARRSVNQKRSKNEHVNQSNQLRFLIHENTTALKLSQ